MHTLYEMENLKVFLCVFVCHNDPQFSFRLHAWLCANYHRNGSPKHKSFYNCSSIFLFILDYKTYTVAIKRLESLDWIYVSHDPINPFDLKTLLLKLFQLVLWIHFSVNFFTKLTFYNSLKFSVYVFELCIT